MQPQPEQQTAEISLRWAWVFAGVFAGAVLIATLVTVLRDVPPRPDVAVLVGILTFALTGLLVGFQSPGSTILEPGVSGIGLALLSLFAFRAVFDMTLSPGWSSAILFGGPLLALAGGWAGEMLQGSRPRDPDAEGIQWAWVMVGALLGVMLNIYAVFVGNALFDLTTLSTFAVFAGSLFVTAVFVGYFSPGVTIVEPGIATFLVIIADFSLVLLGFQAPFPVRSILVASAGAFVIALAGGYLGEVGHNLRWHSAWGDEPDSYRETPRP